MCLNGPHFRLSTLPPALAVTLLIAMTSLFVSGCGGGVDQFDYRLDGADAVCSSGTAGPVGRVRPARFSLGDNSNAIRTTQDVFWIVQSGSNTVARYHVGTGSFSRNFIDVGQNRGPYDIAVDLSDQRAFITNWQSDSLTVADTATGNRIDELGRDPFDNPQGVAVTDDYVYVTNIDYRSEADPPFGPGYVTILERGSSLSTVGTMQTVARNPQFARTIDTPQGQRIAIVDSGSIELDENGPPTADDAALELWTPNGHLSEDARSTYPLPVSEDRPLVGAPGRPAVTPDGRYLYVASATGPYLFKFDLQQRQWVRDTDNPIAVYQTDEKSLNNAAIDSRGILYLTAYNEDAMYLVDTACDEVLAGPIPLGRSESLLEGPLSVGLWENGDDIRVYYNMSEGNALGYIDATY